MDKTLQVFNSLKPEATKQWHVFFGQDRVYKKRKPNACQHLRIGIFHRKAWISGFPGETRRPGHAGPRAGPGHGRLELRSSAACRQDAILHFATVSTTPYHPAPGLLHLLTVLITRLASASFCLGGGGFTTANSPSKISEELGLALSSSVTLGKLLPLSPPHFFFFHLQAGG